MPSEQVEPREPEPQPAEEPREPAPQPARPDPKAFARANARALSALALLAAGVVLVLLGWYGAAHTNILSEQIPYLISGGLLGLGLIIVAGFMAYGAGAEGSIRELRRDIAFALGRLATARPGAADAAEAGAETVGGIGRVFAVSGGRSYHVAGCPIIEGKEGVRALELHEAAGAGLAACKLCGPD